MNSNLRWLNKPSMPSGITVLGLKQRWMQYVIQLQDGKPPHGCKGGRYIGYNLDFQKMIVGSVIQKYGNDFGDVCVWFENYGTYVTINMDKK